MSAYGSGCINPHFLDLGTNWRRVVSFTPRPLYPRYPLHRRLGGPQSQSGPFGELKILDLSIFALTRYYPVTISLSVYVDFNYFICNSQNDSSSDKFVPSEIKSGETDHEFTLINTLVALRYASLSTIRNKDIWY
jgi:hypothetical protein